MTSLKINAASILLTLAFFATFCSCEHAEETYLHKEGKTVLAFSCDTLCFDSLFCTMGSTTKAFAVYNRNSEAVKISRIAMRGGASSRFRFNVDGDTSRVVKDIVIPAHDSIFVFVGANISPTGETTPFLVEDFMQFDVEGCSPQSLVVNAYGRDAVYHIPDQVLYDAEGTEVHYSVIDCDNWDHTRPHVIVGYAVVDSGCTLNLVAGDELYFATDAVLWIYDQGSLHSQGTTEQPVLFTSMRHDGWYSFLPGQWGYIWLSRGSHDNYIDEAIIENGYLGLLVDTIANDNPTLTISNTVVRHESLSGILAQGSHVIGENLLVYNCSTATLALQFGGHYEFSNCTFANYWNYSPRTNPQVVINNYYRDPDKNIVLRDLELALFTQCIIYGSYSDGEVMFEIDEQAEHNIGFDRCIVKGYKDYDIDPMFADIENENFHLKEGSPALTDGIGYQFPDGQVVEK